MEKMIIPRFRYLLTLVAILCLSACQGNLLSKLDVEDTSGMFESIAGELGTDDAQEKMLVNKIEFSKDYKYFSVWTGIQRDIGPYPLTDSTVVQIEVESHVDGVKRSRRETPRLLRALNTERDNVKELGVKTLVLVDLSLTQEQIDAQLAAVEEMLTVFDENNLYLAFVSGKTVSPSWAVSPYILEKYFTKNADQKLLYRSILNKIQEVEAGEEPWGDARQVKLVVFSDGDVYDPDNKPYDREHFKLENSLLQTASDKNHPSVFYVDFGKNDDEDSESHNILTSLCEATGGAFLPSFNWTVLETAMVGPDIRAVASNRFDFENPDGKIYHGDKQELKLLFYTVKDHRLIASATGYIQEGSFFQPIIVHGNSFAKVLFAGFSVGLLILLITYFLGQIVIPYLRYRRFLKKYVIRHTGKKMAVGDTPVAESCYLCKAPFVEGDEVVVKCEHTMHKHCWDENEYHCPEYGRHCKHGSHFYDREHLFDERNASFYLKWLLMAIIVGITAWVCFTVVANFPHKHLMEYLLPTEDVAKDMMNTHLTQLPSYGFILSFFLTMGVAYMAFRRRRWTDYLDIVLRGLVAGLCSALLYLLTNLACFALGLVSAPYQLSLIPWTLSSYLCAVVGTYGTRIRLKKTLVLIAVGVSLMSLLLWSLLYIRIHVDFRVLLLYSTLLYMVGMVLAIASEAPRSEHYFLHVEGAVKTMDVALYKWFRSDPNAVVTLGRSVDCSLQLSWDMHGHMAKVHAEIVMRKGVLYLRAREEGVLLAGKPLPVDKEIILYHGNQFQIGHTFFTYLEKDI